jgi:hypothetical protein
MDAAIGQELEKEEKLTSLHLLAGGITGPGPTSSYQVTNGLFAH